jgi:hypothetical protein
MFTYPMLCENRQRERNEKIIKDFQTNYKHFIDLQKEGDIGILEGTGSLIFDVENKKVYAELYVALYLHLGLKGQKKILSTYT